MEASGQGDYQDDSRDRRAPSPERDDADLPFVLVAPSAGVVLGRTIWCGSYRRYRAVGPLRQATRLQLLPDRKRLHFLHGPLSLDGEEPPRPRDPFELVFAAVLESS
jgi:hypothetical protein